MAAPSGRRGLGHQQRTSMTGSTSLASIPSGTKGVMLQAETQDVRYTTDGTVPSASNGFLLKAGAAPTEYVGDPSKLRFIEATSGAKLNVGYIAPSYK